MLNPHVEKLEASTPWLILGANTKRYGGMIRKGTEVLKCTCKDLEDSTSEDSPKHCLFCSISSHLSGEMASCEVEGFVKKEEQIHEGKGSPAPSGHNGGFSGSSKSIPLVPDPNSKCHGAAHLSRPCPSSGDLASTLSTVPSMICPRISPSSAGATSVSPVIGKPQTSSSINSPVNNSPGSPHPLSPTLVHFPAYSSSASCHLQESDVSEIDVHWKHCLIGFVAGKCLGYAALLSYINRTWQHRATFTMHDSG
uniref:Uncharacterized protein n=1 Tax=Populus alba TaxID=43335 RepID=A0A4U5QNC3_POPAL|nr:hypothetical protein D5086_0000084740 [Populus alba]